MFLRFILQLPKGYFLMQKRGTAMPRLNLKVVGNHRCRCNNNSPRCMRENHYAILASGWKFPMFSSYKISITLFLIIICLGKSFIKTLVKIHNFIDNRQNRVVKLSSLHSESSIFLIFPYSRPYGLLCSCFSLIEPIINWYLIYG